MPFTVTHVAAVLPIAAIARRTLPVSALVIGSMIPDFPMFVPVGPRYNTTHSIAGTFTACVPLGFVCFVVFHAFMKRPLFALLPDFIRRRCTFLVGPDVEPAFTLLRLIAIAIAVAIGASTHVFWDSFTHVNRWGTFLFPSLKELIVFPGGLALPRYQALQDGCSVALLPLMLLLACHWLVRQPPERLDGRPGLPVVWKLTIYAITILIPVVLSTVVWTLTRWSPYMKLFRSVQASGLAFGIFVLVYCAGYHSVSEGRRS